MGVEKNDSSSNALPSSRSTKATTVNIYRPPALRCQSYESADLNAVKNDKKIESNSKTKTTTTPTTPTACSISVNSSPIHANENQLCNPLTSQHGVSVLAHATTTTTNTMMTLSDEISKAANNTQQHDDDDEHSEQQQQEQHKISTGIAASRRERRPDRAVYIPRARRSQTTPPTTTTTSTTTTTTTTQQQTAAVNEQQLPITLDVNAGGLVSMAPPTKQDDLSKSQSSSNKKSKSSSVNKERKERSSKKHQTIKNSASLELSAIKNENASELVEEQETKEKNCDSVKQHHRLKPLNNKNKNISNTEVKNLKSPPPPPPAALVEAQKQDSSSHVIVVGKSKSKSAKMAESGRVNDYPNMHIEDVLSGDRIPAKCDIDEQELQRASKEINRSNRRIMKQTFVSDVLEIPDKIDGIDSKKSTPKSFDHHQPTAVINSSSRSSNVETTTTDEEEDDCDDDWESMYDENGDCLDPKIIQELTASVGKVKIELPKMDYTAYLTKQSILNEEEFPHVLEVSNFPVEFKNQDLLMLFAQYKQSGFDIKWVDDTHALAIFSSSRIAAEVLTMGHPFVMLKPLAKATMESRLKAKKCAASLQPYRPRPETCAALARRLVTGALGVKLSTAAAERENEKRVLREAKERKLLAAKQRDEVWES